MPSEIHPPFLKVLLEEPADFLNPYWYEQLDGINWNEDGKALVIYDRVGPVWNPHFPSSLFLNHGIKRLHLSFSSAHDALEDENWIEFFLGFLPGGKVSVLGAESALALTVSDFPPEQLYELFQGKKVALVSFESKPAAGDTRLDPESPSFSRLKEMIASAGWALLKEGRGCSLFFSQPNGKQFIDAIAEKARDRGWSLYLVKSLYDFKFSDKDKFLTSRELPSSVKQLV